MNIGKAIKLCRVQKDMLQSELAKKSGMSVAYLSLIEKGKRDPNISVLKTLSTALNVPLSILVFLGADKNELEGFDIDLREKLSATILEVVMASSNETTQIPQ
jgi:transcriptional regulator with XRE-family HTH domain